MSDVLDIVDLDSHLTELIRLREVIENRKAFQTLEAEMKKYLIRRMGGASIGRVGGLRFVTVTRAYPTRVDLDALRQAQPHLIAAYTHQSDTPVVTVRFVREGESRD